MQRSRQLSLFGKALAHQEWQEEAGEMQCLRLSQTFSAAEINFTQKDSEQLAKPPSALRLKYTPVLHTKLGLAGLDLEQTRKKVATFFVLVYCHCPGHRVWEKQ